MKSLLFPHRIVGDAVYAVYVLTVKICGGFVHSFQAWCFFTIAIHLEFEGDATLRP